MLREETRFDGDMWGMRPRERSCTASGRRIKTAAHKFEIVAFSGSDLSRTIKQLARRLMLISRGLLCAALLWAGMASGTAALGQTRNDAADRDMADRYYRAAQAGDDVAQFYLGSLYAAGVGRPQSDTEAFQWIERAAQRGNAQAMLVAGALTALGKGTPKDYVTSYKWAFLVAEGSQAMDMKNGGRQLVSMLEPRMTADQIQRAKTQAYQFRAVGTVAAPATLAAAPAPAVAPAPPALQPQQAPKSSTAPPPQPVASASGGTPAQSPSALEAEARKHLNKENVDRLMKNVPPAYRKRFGL